MSGLVRGPVTVATPASSANLGPGFDALGLALSRYDEVSAEVVSGGGLEVEVEGVGADDVPRDESHLVVRAIRALFDDVGVQQPGLRVRCVNRIPHARGLGSSSAAIVGGITAGRALLGDAAYDDAAALRLASHLEGHPDNVAAALLGGLTVAWTDADGTADALRLDVRTQVAVFVPPDGVKTEVARGLLPRSVPHADAASNAGRAALLVGLLATDAEPPARLLVAATRDLLHQAYRAPAMPDSLDLVERLRSDGVPAIVSGAGPTVLAFGTAEAPAESLVARVPAGWTAWSLTVDDLGARVLRP